MSSPGRPCLADKKIPIYDLGPQRPARAQIVYRLRPAQAGRYVSFDYRRPKTGISDHWSAGRIAQQAEYHCVVTERRAGDADDLYPVHGEFPSVVADWEAGTAHASLKKSGYRCYPVAVAGVGRLVCFSAHGCRCRFSRLALAAAPQVTDQASSHPLAG